MHFLLTETRETGRVRGVREEDSASVNCYEGVSQQQRYTGAVLESSNLRRPKAGHGRAKEAGTSLAQRRTGWRA